MKFLPLILLLTSLNYSTDINSLRQLFIKAPISESNLMLFEQALNKSTSRSSNLVKGYKGCFYFIKCKFIKQPINKFIYFQKGKKLLESAIIEDPKSIELRFLRYTIQKNIPKFLMYYNNIEKDINFVNENIQHMQDKNAKEFIVNSLKSIPQ